MAKFAPVAGIEMMEKLLETGPDYIGPYHLWLAHDVLRDPDRWARLATNIQKVHREPITIIMDNSLIELGHPLPPVHLEEAFKAVSADYLVLPDVLEDRNETLRLGADFVAGLTDWKPPLLGVVQGKTIADLLLCAQTYDSWGVKALSVPRIVRKNLRCRKLITRELSRAYPSKSIHLLGFSDDLQNDLETARMKLPNLMGIDSAVPIRVGQQMRLLTNATARIVGPRDPDYLDDPTPPTAFTLVNILELRRDIE